MRTPALRHSVRALVIHGADRVMLCRHELPGGSAVWAAPGGGIEPGETPLDALRRELSEEVGLDLPVDPPLVWHQVVESIGPGDPADPASGQQGVINDYFLVHTLEFTPRPGLSSAELAAENITALAWWRLSDIAEHRGPDAFSPRDLAALLSSLIVDGVPEVPLELGL